jgi:hypothetical protein
MIFKPFETYFEMFNDANKLLVVLLRVLVRGQRAVTQIMSGFPAVVLRPEARH